MSAAAALPLDDVRPPLLPGWPQRPDAGALQALLRAASGLLDCPAAAIMLTEPGRSGVLASHGMPGWPDRAATPDAGVCARAAAQRSVLCLTDLACEPQPPGLPPRPPSLLRFHAAAPIHGPEGQALGVLCVVDTVPRTQPAERLRQLADLAQAAGALIGMERSLRVAALAPSSTLPAMAELAEEGYAALLTRLRAGGLPASILSAARLLRRAGASAPPGPPNLAARLRAVLRPAGEGTAAMPFSLAFQPMLALDGPHRGSLEALVRWEIEPGLFVAPSDFVPLAERLGLVSHLDRWVLREACAAAVQWPEPWSVFVNVSAASFGGVDVAAMAGAALASTGLPAERLVVEMTETALAGDEFMARRSVEQLRELGVRVALDDFGAGHSSLSSLRRFPFSVLKIDRELTRRIAQDHVQAHLVGLVAELGRVLGVPVAAEGVETPDDLRAVSRLGCTRAQGYLLSRPVAPGKVREAMGQAAQALRDALAGETAVVAS